MMTFVKIAAIAMALALAWYLFGSFIAATLDISAWGRDSGGRFMIAMFWLGSTIATVAKLSLDGDL